MLKRISRGRITLGIHARALGIVDASPVPNIHFGMALKGAARRDSDHSVTT